MGERCEECPTCGFEDVIRIPTNFTNLSKPLEKNKKVGDTTKEFIEDAKHELQQHKKELGEKR